MFRPGCNLRLLRNEYGREGRLSPSETHLKELLLKGLAGDASAYHAFLKALAAHLRAFLRKPVSRAELCLGVRSALLLDTTPDGAAPQPGLRAR